MLAAAVPHAVLATCGAEGAACCEYTGFGTGSCSGALACWEGVCMLCGADGSPACAEGPPCGEGLTEKDHFCVPGPAEPSAEQQPAPVVAVGAARADMPELDMPEAEEEDEPAPAFESCGDLKWPCCDIPDNDPNGGTCRDDTLLTCWEGTCKRCGTDGMPACAGPKPCTGKLIVKNNFCTFDNTQPPEAGPPPAKTTPAEVKPAPAFESCGDLKWPCCDIPDNDPNAGTCRDDTLLTCWEGTCKRCGTDGMPACAGPKPCTGKLIVKNDFCTFDNGEE
eukprot:jgi/Ulvmu1/11006/UM007_0186.1